MEAVCETLTRKLDILESIRIKCISLNLWNYVLLVVADNL